MSRDQKQDESRLDGREQLLEYFYKGSKGESLRAVGTEHEKFLYEKSTGKFLNFDGIEAVLESLAERFGYERAFDEGRLVALERGDEAITLEPGGQFELSGGIKKTIFETAAELDRHFEEIREVAPDVGMACLGLNPFDDVAEIGWVPKSRYRIMRDYLPTKANMPHWMMKLTCTIQANVDFVSEADAVDQMRTAYLISPFANALFANSPVDHGRPNGYQSYRAHIWTEVDPDRTGVPDFVLSNDWGFEDYLEYVLDVPLFFIRRENRYVNLAGRSFRELMTTGIDGHHATMGDFELHLSTVFPEVRLKRYIEVRSADGGPASHMTGLSAFWKGLLYDYGARTSAYDLLHHLDTDQLRSTMRLAAKTGLADPAIRGLAAELLSLSKAGLTRLAQANGHDDEGVFLTCLDDVLAHGTQADLMLQRFSESSTRLDVLKQLSI